MNVRPSITTMSSREFNQDLARAKRAAKSGPVFVTDRGKSTHVLLDFEEFSRLKLLQEEDRFRGRKMSEILAMPDGDDIELELPERKDYPRIVDFD